MARYRQVAAGLGRRGRAVFPVTKVMTYMNSANLAQQRLAPAEFGKFVADVRKRITRSDVFSAVFIRRPFVGIAAKLLKLSPALYGRIYAKYASRAYAV